jgi:glycosyltransferase involved in cell wall biosynthesis
MAPGPNPRGTGSLVKLARQERADILHTHGYKGDILLGFLPARRRPAPLVATVHGYTDVSWFDRVALYNRLDRIALRRADRVVLVHQGMAERPGLNRLNDPKWSVIENGIAPAVNDADAAFASALDTSLLARCAGHRPVIGAIGRLSREKGFDILLHACRDVLREQPSGLLVILGEGPERAALERTAADLGIGDRVVMPGYRENARGYLRLFDVFVLPSYSEGLPVTVLEAMQAGTPIVASRVGGVPAVLDEGKGGILTNPGDPDDVRKAIAQALQRDDRTAGMVALARERVQARYTSAAMTRRYVELYGQLIGGRQDV